MFKIKKKTNRFIKGCMYFIQALFIYLLYIIFKILPLDAASAFGGFLLQTLGPWSYKQKIAEANLKYIFPEKNIKEIKQITKKMWNNIGRILAEFCNSNKFEDKYKDRIKIIGGENLEELIKQNRGGIFTSAHFGNWEISGIIGSNHGMKMHLIYRNPNNYFLKPLFKLRKRTSTKSYIIPKDKNTAKKIVKALRNSEYVGMLVDQKISSGVKIDFLGKPAMVLDSMGLFALKLNCPIIPARIKRTHGVNFEAIIYPPFYADKENNTSDEVEKIARKSSQLLEDWIKESPEQWLWIHDRWGLAKKGLV